MIEGPRLPCIFVLILRSVIASKCGLPCSKCADLIRKERCTMKVQYFPEDDVVYIELKDGLTVGIEISNASKFAREVSRIRQD